MSIAIVNNYCSRRLHMQEFCGKNFTVPLAYMLTAQTNYIRSDSDAHIRLFCAHGRKNARLMCLCYSVL